MVVVCVRALRSSLVIAYNLSVKFKIRSSSESEYGEENAGVLRARNKIVSRRVKV